MKQKQQFLINPMMCPKCHSIPEKPFYSEQTFFSSFSSYNRGEFIQCSRCDLKIKLNEFEYESIERKLDKNNTRFDHHLYSFRTGASPTVPLFFVFILFILFIILMTKEITK